MDLLIRLSRALAMGVCRLSGSCMYRRNSEVAKALVLKGGEAEGSHPRPACTEGGKEGATGSNGEAGRDGGLPCFSSVLNC